ncbi:hypothetical protein Fmac_023794 [Flemingia macrophylla]|uniref:O-methyltransferase C-terminal domain-containing protein n=1 Tax=Flemingia macrophylla TaxID=520843 RepID=A0ABD1LML9_9FABA
MGDSNVTKNHQHTTSSQQTEDGACLSALLLSANLVYPAALNAAIELNLFEIIAKGTTPDEKCLEILSNCLKALSPNGKIVVMEYILPEDPKPTKESRLISTLDNLMFNTVGGRERTQKQYKNLCKLSEFSNFQGLFTCFKSINRIMVLWEFRWSSSETLCTRRRPQLVRHVARDSLLVEMRVSSRKMSSSINFSSCIEGCFFAGNGCDGGVGVAQRQRQGPAAAEVPGSSSDGARVAQQRRWGRAAVASGSRSSSGRVAMVAKEVPGSRSCGTRVQHRWWCQGPVAVVLGSHSIEGAPHSQKRLAAPNEDRKSQRRSQIANRKSLVRKQIADEVKNREKKINE